MRKEDLPAWVLKCKEKGTQICKIKDRYYLYKIKSKWNSEKKCSTKITESYLGAITKEGLVPSKHKRLESTYKHITVKEFGATFFLHSISGDIIKELKQFFPREWKELFVLATLRLSEKAPLKKISFYYETSFLSELLAGTRTSKNFLGPFLRDVGVRRESIKSFMRSFMISTEYAIIDITNIFSYSKGMLSATLGHNNHSIFLPQVNLILIYSSDKLQPVYFRQVPGSISDVSTLIKTTNELAVDNFIFIGDKGFHSNENVLGLKENNINYSLTLRRDSSHIDYQPIAKNDRKTLGGYFMYANKHIWYCVKKKNDEQIITYLDEALKAEEESDLVRYIKELETKEKLKESEKKQLEEYKKRLFEIPFRNGTISVRTNLTKEPEEIFQIMKSRVDVEQAFDTFKNVLEADRTYMRDDKQLEGWLFINFIAMQLYYKIYAMLLEKKMLNNFTPVDILTYLKRVNKMSVKGDWQLAEIPKKTREAIKKLKIDIPIT
jgi:hypothetical protein